MKFETVRHKWERITGLPWSEAKKMGFTDGSYDKNILLSKSLDNKGDSILNNKKKGKLVIGDIEETTLHPKGFVTKYIFDDYNNLVNKIKTPLDKRTVGEKISDLIGSYGNSVSKSMDNAAETLSDYANMAYNYVDRHYFDEDVSVKGSIVTPVKTTVVGKVVLPEVYENVQELDYRGRPVSRGIKSIDGNNFEIRNRGGRQAS